MFTQDEIAFYGFFNNGKHLLDEFRSLLTQPMLSMRGLSQFELIVLESDITVTFRRSVQSALHELPWCHFWGDCDAREPYTGFDERYGARPLQRAIDRYVVTPLAAWMLEHQQVTDCRLSLDWSGGLLVNIEQFPE